MKFRVREMCEWEFCSGEFKDILQWLNNSKESFSAPKTCWISSDYEEFPSFPRRARSFPIRLVRKIMQWEKKVYKIESGLKNELHYPLVVASIARKHRALCLASQFWGD